MQTLFEHDLRSTLASNHDAQSFLLKKILIITSNRQIPIMLLVLLPALLKVVEPKD